jgi:DNA-binding protein YbaB
MFSQNAQLKNVQALAHARPLVEKMVNEFEQQEFTATEEAVTVTVKGDLTVKSFGEGDSVSVSSVEAAYKAALGIATHERHLAFVKVRNTVLKKYRIDLASHSDDVAKAIAYKESMSKKAS